MLRQLSGSVLRSTRLAKAPRAPLPTFQRGFAKIVYTETDEAPYLATFALLPIIQRFAKPAGIEIEKSDISVAARIISQFNDRLKPEQQVPDNLAELGELAKTPDANIIKLPNISASIPQLQEAITELQSQGYNVPDFVPDPKTEEEKEIAARYSKVLGSAVNPVLREGNSDRRVAEPVKKYAQKNPHKMGGWDSGCKTHVSHLPGGDFYGSEKSYTVPSATSVKIELVHGVAPSGNPGSGGALQTTMLKSQTKLMAGEVIDAACMSKSALRTYLEEQMQDAKEKDILLSLHLKATMMKVSDPIMFGHAVSVYFRDTFGKFGDKFKSLGINPNNGLGDVYAKIQGLPESERVEIEQSLQECYAKRPRLAMVDSGRGITNLHTPNDIIVDASMPVVVRDGGKMWNKDDALEDTKCLIPDRCYAGVYQAILDDCRDNGQFDVATMGNVSNVGLMAQKAEEYGSHDKTFQIPASGTVKVTDEAGQLIFEHAVEEGDIWRMCQTKDAPIKDWVELAVSRSKATGAPVIFWLDQNRGHDAQLIIKINKYIGEIDTEGVEWSIMKPVDAIKESMKRARSGKDTISATGNVLRDYLTDLFPILELGTSAKMLSIVPLLAGGGLYETGAGGSAPKHVQQFVKEGHLRWDSLGEYLAMAVALEDHGNKTNDPKARVLGQTLSEATGKWLDHRKSPSRKVAELDNRGSSFYIALYWAQAMAKHDPDFAKLEQALQDNRATIVEEFSAAQGKPVDIGGYYHPDPTKATLAMRPSKTFNSIIDSY
jgi:isocitrate dehydrogenase